MQFADRQEAGTLLARQLNAARFTRPLVLALPRGGVPVAAPVAAKLRAPLEVLLVRKIASPRNPEFALGALVEGGSLYLNPGAESVLRDSERVSLMERESERIREQQRLYRGGSPLPSWEGRSVILVDDGMATGATMIAAIRAVQGGNPLEVMVAVPVCSDTAGDAVRKEGAELVALVESDHLMSVGQWYKDFSQVEDPVVQALLGMDPPAVGPTGSPGNELRRFIHTLADLLEPIDSPEALAPLIQRFRSCKTVLLGESTHGTSEFYRMRDRISRILLEGEGFEFLAVEGDWPDLAKLHRYIRRGEGRNAKSVLRGFKRWPTWMWSNAEMAEAVEWFRESGVRRGKGLYGLDLYSFFESMEAVVEHVRKINPFLANAIERRYACFEPYERDEIAYARSLRHIPEGCAEEVIRNLEEMLGLRLTEGEDGEERFGAIQNARIAVNAENYYRALLSGDAASWNVRDSHMLDTLDLLLERRGKGIVWAHNTHIGDYRATDMEREGYVNLGGLARRMYGEQEVGLVGFGTMRGRTLASVTWGGREQAMNIPSAPKGTLEACFHEALKLRRLTQGFVIPGPREQEALSLTLGHRAIGVVYPSGKESRSHYVPTVFSKRYDAFVFIDETTPLRSLHASAGSGRFPETWPGGS
jgi:erythromycin esterase-like protein/predicted phosphoribosyltransferase